MFILPLFNLSPNFLLHLGGIHDKLIFADTGHIRQLDLRRIRAHQPQLNPLILLSQPSHPPHPPNPPPLLTSRHRLADKPLFTSLKDLLIDLTRDPLKIDILLN
jgi:hypothetical protein